MFLKIVVLAKQVPDTRNVGKDAMKEDGTVNRAALPAIFNPDDMNALEQALRLKDQYPNVTVELLTMGPDRAAEIIREGLFRGADGGVLLSDRKFAGADTLATSYALAQAIRKMQPDMVLAGRQAIDGDTAQVGPQVAAKLNWPQVTYAQEIMGFKDDHIIIKRRLEQGVELVSSPLPLVITVHGSAAPCRPRHAQRLIKYKKAMVLPWSVGDVGGDEGKYGLTGSPTRVKKIENIVFQVKETKRLSASEEEITDLFRELIHQHTIG
ncbi:MAG: electron transfer flavoprotein subunit beta/FixA family protein [Bacteroidetes bacterium]|nr:electron transfer flavoprotein subunit beta/FixA family protein [Bacteroidota bacterium]